MKTTVFDALKAMDDGKYIRRKAWGGGVFWHREGTAVKCYDAPNQTDTLVDRAEVGLVVLQHADDWVVAEFDPRLNWVEVMNRPSAYIQDKDFEAFMLKQFYGLTPSQIKELIRRIYRYWMISGGTATENSYAIKQLVTKTTLTEAANVPAMGS